jgi:hypothetical protein
MPALDAHFFSNSRLYVSGSGGMGNGLLRGSMSRGPCSPGDSHHLFSFLIKRLQVVVGNRPVGADAVETLVPEVLGRKPRRHAAPMHRHAAHLHRARLQRPLDLIAVEMIAQPRILAVAKEARARRGALRSGTDSSPASTTTTLALVVRASRSATIRGADARSDDADVTLHDASH